MKLATRPGVLALDARIAACAFVAGCGLLALGGFVQIPAAGDDLPRWLFYPVLALMSVALLLRRLAPLTGLAIGLVALAADTYLGGSLANILVFTQVLYEACVHGPARFWRWALRVSIVITVVAAGIGVAVAGSWRGAAVGTPFALAFVLSVVSAISVRQYREQAVAERTRAETTARLAELDRQRAVTAERNRMARELHDVIANHLSAVAIHATALLSVRGMDPAASEQALQVIRSSSVRGLAEMREMVNLLREPGSQGNGAESGSDEPPAVVRLSEADQLVFRARQAGLAASLRVTGAPRPLPHDVDLATYRILQESLTNALKHGDGTVEVAVGYQPRAVCLRVTNLVSAAGSAVPGSGSGVIGMRERAVLLGGTLSAGRRDGVWRVEALLPTAEEPAVTGQPDAMTTVAL